MDAMYDTVFGVLVGECLVEELRKLVEEGFELSVFGSGQIILAPIVACIQI